MKHCSKCGEKKDLSEFRKDKSTKDMHGSACRMCHNVAAIKYRREVMGCLPMSENKECPPYLGVVIAERLVNHLFKDVVRMPYGNIGFDFICANDKKIDVKSACVTLNHGKTPYWQFMIRKNTTADFFLLLAFNNRSDLEPLHQWLVPGYKFNKLVCASVAPSTIDKWDEWRQPIGPAIACCNILRKDE